MEVFNTNTDITMRLDKDRKLSKQTDTNYKEISPMLEADIDYDKINVNAEQTK